jgi:murein L,D-transpeptidase YcbB/YkuD
MPLWLEDGRPTAHADEAIAALRTATARGLEPRDYGGDSLGEWRNALAGRRRGTAADLARFDVTLSLALSRMLSHLRFGRVSPRLLGFDYDAAPAGYDVAALVRDAAQRGRAGEIVEQAEPPYAQRHLLERQLARYRTLASDATIGPPVLVPPVRPGALLAGSAELARWLTALGDLPGDAALPGTYEGVLVEAVQRFQLRHGLDPDGVIGAQTTRALAVPAAARVEQIVLALERLRWIPRLERGRVVVVNVPAFTLFAFDDVGTGRPPAAQMAVVVGQAVRTETPVFTAAMRRVVFAPYWNVPPSIARNEILPKLRRDPGYLGREEMEIVGVSGGGVLPPTAAVLAELAQGSVQLRQRPGAKNALGRVKFLFPNRHNVYLHDTPSRSLFQRARRDFSHGCIRVADAAGLARWVLGAEGWDAERVDRMLADGVHATVELQAPIPVVIAYTTAVARFEGTISFAEDIYGHDTALARALAAPETGAL